MSENQKIKVSVITGFLGAGKTTFINTVLKQNTEIRFALVENEFGDVSIDTKLIKGVDASQMFELKQGCICCTITDEFELVLRELAERFPDVEHVLIETTGIADPASVIRPFFADENLTEIYQYSGTICLIDALNFNDSPEKELAIKQVVVADLMMIAKSEEVSESKKEKFRENLESINPFAEIKYFHPDDYLEIQLHSIQKKKKSLFDFVSTGSVHNEIQTRTLSFERPLNKAEFVHWLEYNLDIYKNRIYRTKGILCFENELYEFILQGVGGSFFITEGDLILEEAKSTVVFIGKLADVDLVF